MHRSRGQPGSTFSHGAPCSHCQINHLEAAGADLSSTLVDCDGIRDALWTPTLTVQVNERIDVPALAQVAGWVIIACGIQAKAGDPDSGVLLPEFIKTDDAADRIVASPL